LTKLIIFGVKIAFLAEDDPEDVDGDYDGDDDTGVGTEAGEVREKMKKRSNLLKFERKNVFETSF
jgi:hypothetical protein